VYADGKFSVKNHRNLRRTLRIQELAASAHAASAAQNNSLTTPFVEVECPLYLMNSFVAKVNPMPVRATWPHKARALAMGD
jgi:hypothetical protein